MSKIADPRRRFTLAQRDQILRAYRDSQLTQAEFAAGAGIGLSTLQRWLHNAGSRPARPTAGFVQVPNLLAQGSGPARYRLRWADGVELAIQAGFEPEELAMLLQLLRTP
jgi:transposase-like protein